MFQKFVESEFHSGYSMNRFHLLIQFCWQLLAKRNEERDQISDVIRQEFVDKLVAADEETRRMKNEIAELKAKQRIELQRAKVDLEVAMKTKDEELEQVHSRYNICVLFLDTCWIIFDSLKVYSM